MKARAPAEAVGLAEAVEPEPGRWLDRAEALARIALDDAPALAEFTATASPDDLRILAELLRGTGSTDLALLADRLVPPPAP